MTRVPKCTFGSLKVNVVCSGGSMIPLQILPASPLQKHGIPKSSSQTSMEMSPDYPQVRNSLAETEQPRNQ